MDLENSKLRKPGVGEWFAGRTILVTGGTGFVGKVLLEKLLRSCPDLERILVLIRPKHGSDPSARIQQMVQLPLFDQLRRDNPAVLFKLFAIESDVTRPDLGLSDDERNLIQSKVSIIFQCDSTTDKGLIAIDAVMDNAGSTENFLKLAEQVTNLDVYLHLSTIFCHIQKEVVEEQTYHTPISPKNVFKSLKVLPKDDLKRAGEIFAELGVHPNGYFISKQLAEASVYEAASKINAVICRTSIVLPVWREPLPGWVDAPRGMMGLTVEGGKGVVRTVLTRGEVNAEVIPVDVAVNSLIAIAWKVGTDKPEGVPVYNLTQGDTNPITFGDIQSKTSRFFYEYPFEGMSWYPNVSYTSNRLKHMLSAFFLHTILSYLLDAMMMFIGKQTFMVRLQKRISVDLEAFQYISMSQWNIRNERFLTLEDNLNGADKKTFYTRMDDLDMEIFFKSCHVGARQYYLKEPMSSLPKANERLNKLYYVDVATKCAIYVTGVWIFYLLLCWIANILF